MLYPPSVVDGVIEHVDKSLGRPEDRTNGDNGRDKEEQKPDVEGRPNAVNACRQMASADQGGDYAVRKKQREGEDNLKENEEPQTD